jgi:hypothetical protein
MNNIMSSSKELSPLETDLDLLLVILLGKSLAEWIVRRILDEPPGHGCKDPRAWESELTLYVAG